MTTASGSGIARQRVEARLADQLELRVRLGERDQAGCGDGSMAPTVGAVLRGPRDQHAGQVAGEGADLDDGARARRPPGTAASAPRDCASETPQWSGSWS